MTMPPTDNESGELLTPQPLFLRISYLLSRRLPGRKAIVSVCFSNPAATREQRRFRGESQGQTDSPLIRLAGS